jgi:hypothetical protein
MSRSSIYEERVVGEESDVLQLLPKDCEGKSILIPFLGTYWSVFETGKEHLRAMIDDDVNGFCDYDSQSILIDEDLALHRKGVTLVHEMLHAVLDSVGIEDDRKLSFKDSDDLIRRLEHGVFDMVNVFPKEFKKVYER